MRSLTYDYFNVSEGKIEYCISKCVYIEMFEQYDIRSLCKIFCMTDTASYENLPKHVRFIRHSDLSDGSCCHDEVIDKRKIRVSGIGCTTPHLTEDEINQYFISAVNQYLSERDGLIENAQTILELLSDTTELER